MIAWHTNHFINGVETDTYLSSNYWAEAENDMYIARRTIGTNFGV